MDNIIHSIIEVLRYYKFEASCPFEYGTKEHFFWHSERQFLENSSNSDSFYQGWHIEAQQYAKSHPNQKNPLTDPDTPEATKAIIIYIDMMLGKWMPHHQDYVLGY